MENTGFINKYLRPFIIPQNALFAIICFISLALRFAFVLYTDLEMSVDFLRYYNTAYALANNLPVEDSQYQALFPHLLGYPAVLSVFFKIFGASLNTAAGLNILLELGSIILLYRISGPLGAALYAVYPTAVMHVPVSCGEPLYMFLMLACIALFLKLSDRNGFKNLPFWALTGVLIAFFNTARPLGIILIIAFSGCFLLFKSCKWSYKLLSLTVMALVFFILGNLYFFWADGVLKEPVSRGGAGWNLYVGLNTEYGGRWNPVDFAVLTEKLDENIPAGEIQDDFFKLALSRLPPSFGLMRAKIRELWFRDDAMVYWISELSKDYFSNSSLLSRICNIYWLLLVLLFIISCYVIIKNRRFSLNVITPFIIITGLFLIFLILEANRRYHFPADALMAMIIGGAFPCRCLKAKI